MMRWGVQARLVRAGLQVGAAALFFLIVGVDLLVRRSYFLGILCVVGAGCVALVIVSVGGVLRRRGLFLVT